MRASRCLMVWLSVQRQPDALRMKNGTETVEKIGDLAGLLEIMEADRLGTERSGAAARR